jgi:vancomycin resistance protein YoaR
MTTATMGRRLGLPAMGRPSWRSAALGFSATFGLALVAIAITSVAVAAMSQGAVLPRVAVGGVNLAGLDRTEAATVLESVLPSLADGEAVIAVGDDSVAIPYAEVGRRYELEAMVADAYAVGRSGNPVTDTLARLRSVFVGANLPLRVHAFDEERLDGAVATAASELSFPMVDATVSPTGTTFTVTPSTVGRGVSEAEIRAALGAELATGNPDDVTLRLEAQLVEPAVATPEAETAAAAATAMSGALRLTVEGAADDEEPISLAPETIAAWITFDVNAHGELAPVLDSAAVTTAVEALAEAVNRDAVDASFSLAGGGLGGVIAAQTGRELDVEASANSLLVALERRGSGASVSAVALAVNVTEPALTTAEAQAALPRMQLVSSWTTYYEVNEGNGFSANITIPAQDIDGTVLAPGETFSFWGGIGPVTVERGYHYGGVIIGGRSVRNGAIGGGICSTSTTLFNAALRYGLEMGERANHFYYIPRYPNGLDATVYSDPNFTQDMTFTNDTENPIVIRGYGSPGQVTFQLWSVPAGRSVVLTNPIVSNQRTAIETTQVDPSLAPGAARRVEYPHHGHDASVTRYVYGPSGELIHQETYFSSYRAVNGITLVGPAS